MFKIHRQFQNSNGIKKSIQKMHDPKRDISTRLKHLKNVLENSIDKDLQKFYEKYFSTVFYIFFESFLQTDANIKVKGFNRAQKEDLSVALAIFEQLIVHLPNLIHQRWQYHSIELIINKLLHPKNTNKMRKEGLHLFLLWIRCLRENMLPRTFLLYECVVPGFYSSQPRHSIETIFKTSNEKKYFFSPVDITCLAPPMTAEESDSKQHKPKYFFDSILELMAVKVQTLKWNQFDVMTLKSFVFIWDLFVSNYLLKIFTGFNFSTNVYSPCLDLPTERKESSDRSSNSSPGVMLLDSIIIELKISVIKWILLFSNFDPRSRTANDRNQETLSRVSKKLLELSNESRSGSGVEVKSTLNQLSTSSISDQSIRLPDTYPSLSNTSTLAGKAVSKLSLTSLDDKLRACTTSDEWIIQSTLFSTKKNVNLIQEIFRQAFMLPISHAPIIKRVLKVYQHWIQDKEVPVFMQYPPSVDEIQLGGNAVDETGLSMSNSKESFSPTSTAMKVAQICAGPETTYQLFITNTSYIFLTSVPPENTKLTRIQIDLCKRVLSMYRYMVVNVYLAQETWVQLLRVLFFIIRMLLSPFPQHKTGLNKLNFSLPSQLAAPLFQTLIVSLIKANLSVPISSEVWDEAVDLLSSLREWQELIEEWAKNVEIITRVFSRYVYHLEVLDLPLDRLTEQKNRLQRKNTKELGTRGVTESVYEQAFKRAVGRRSISFISGNDGRKRFSFFPMTSIDDDQETSTPASPSLNPRGFFALSAVSSNRGSEVSLRKGNSDPYFLSSSISQESHALRKFSSVSEIYEKNSSVDGSSPANVSSEIIRSPRNPLKHSNNKKSSISFSHPSNDAPAWIVPLYDCFENDEIKQELPDEMLSIDGRLEEFSDGERDAFTDLAAQRLQRKDSFTQRNTSQTEVSRIRSTPSLLNNLDLYNNMDFDEFLLDERFGSRQSGLVNSSSPKPGYHEGFRILASNLYQSESRNNSISLTDISAAFKQLDHMSSSHLKRSYSDRAIAYSTRERKDGAFFSISEDSHSSYNDAFSVRDAPSGLPSDVEAILPEIPEEDEDLELTFGMKKTKKNSAQSKQKLHWAEISAFHSNNCGTLTGGSQTGWSAPVAVVIWRRLLGILGDVNLIKNPDIHKLVFQNLVQVWEVLFKLRQNIGVSADGETSSVSQELVPPLTILSPWAFKASMGLPDSHKEGKLQALQLLCKTTIQRSHDTELEREHLAQFYATLHEALNSQDQDIVNVIIENCSLFFTYCLPGSTLLLLDFIQAVNKVCSSSNSLAPRVEAQRILGSTLFFPNTYNNLPVIKPNEASPSVELCPSFKNYMIDALLNTCKAEPTVNARCIALSNAGLWLYEELTSSHEVHPKLNETINVLLLSLKFNHPVVVATACFQLRLLTQCIDNIVKLVPDVPHRVLEVMSYTILMSLHHNDGKKNEAVISQLVVHLLLCILDWCMCVPIDVLFTITAHGGKSVLQVVIKAVEAASHGKISPAKMSQSLSNIANRETSDNSRNSGILDSAGNLNSRTKPQPTKPQPKKTETTDPSMKLASNLVLNHLTNYLGQFPSSRGVSVLSSLVSENHDLENGPWDLTPKLFNSPDVQFFTLGETFLMSVVETPAPSTSEGEENKAMSGMKSSDRCVRFIVRHPGGKYCWDSIALYGPSNIEEMTNPVQCELPDDFNDALLRTQQDCMKSYETYVSRNLFCHSKLTSAPLPAAGVPPCVGAVDKLDQLLQHISAKSSECLLQPGVPLNFPAPTPSPILETTDEHDVLVCMLRHHQNLLPNVHEKKRASCLPNDYDGIESRSSTRNTFRYARLLCREFGFLSRISRQKIHLLTKNERLLRELKNLDSRNCRETHKVALFYIANGQEDKVSILSNTGGSREYEDFVAGLGWEVDLETHQGFRGKLQSNGSTGKSCPYYATSTLEVVFHVSTRFPSNDDEAMNVKIRHLGNDEVHIVWSEHHRDYRRGIIPTEFGDVLIVIYPIKHGLYRIQIMKKQEIPFFGPLFDGAVVNGRVLPVLVRETAVNAGRAKRALINLYQPFYEERTRYLQQIVLQFKNKNTFEEYCAGLYKPVFLKKKKRTLPGKTSFVELSSEVIGRQNTNNNSATSVLKTESNPTSNSRLVSSESVSDASRLGLFSSTLPFGIANSISNIQSTSEDSRRFSTPVPPRKFPSPTRFNRTVSFTEETVDPGEQSSYSNTMPSDSTQKVSDSLSSTDSG